jgi:hypothetical protein
MRQQYVVRLPEEERAALLTMIGRGAAPARYDKRADSYRTAWAIVMTILWLPG